MVLSPAGSKEGTQAADQGAGGSLTLGKVIVTQTLSGLRALGMGWGWEPPTENCLQHASCFCPHLLR